MIKNKSLIIFGGTGFIGYHLAKKSLKKKWKVTSVSTHYPKRIRRLSKVKYIKCDINNKIKLKKIINKKYTYVVNLAGYVNHLNKNKTFQSHYIGCKNLVNTFLNYKPKAFVQLGSSLEYGKLKSPHKENKKCRPQSTYGKAKYLASKYLLSKFKKDNFPVTILRLYQSYGPKQDSNRFIPIIITSCLKNKRFPCSEGKQYRDFIHIDDVIKAIFKSLLTKKAKGRIINIGSGRPENVKKIIERIKNIIKKGEPQYGKIKLRREESLLTYPSVLEAKRILKWEPKISLNKGLASTIKFYSENKK